MDNFVTKAIGGSVGGLAGLVALGFIVTIIIIIIIVIVTVVVCVRNKHCPLYKRKHRQQPRVGVIEIAAQEDPLLSNNTSLAQNEEDLVKVSNIVKGMLY